MRIIIIRRLVSRRVFWLEIVIMEQESLTTDNEKKFPE